MGLRLAWGKAHPLQHRVDALLLTFLLTRRRRLPHRFPDFVSRRRIATVSAAKVKSRISSFKNSAVRKKQRKATATVPASFRSPRFHKCETTPIHTRAGSAGSRFGPSR